MANRTKFTSKKRDTFLDALGVGYSVAKACAAVGISRRTAYDHKEADEDFASQWELAVEQGTDELEDIALDRAKESSDTLLIFLLKSRRPDKYAERRQIDANTTMQVVSAEPMSADEWEAEYGNSVETAEGAAEGTH